MFFNNMFVSNTATTSNADENFALGVALLVECGRLFCFVIFSQQQVIVHVPSVACVIAARALELFGEITVQQALRKWTDSIYPPLARTTRGGPAPLPPTRRCENAADISALEIERDIMRQQRPSVPAKHWVQAHLNSYAPSKSCLKWPRVAWAGQQV
jgi:hypothetical protein